MPISTRRSHGEDERELGELHLLLDGAVLAEAPRGAHQVPGDAAPSVPRGAAPRAAAASDGCARCACRAAAASASGSAGSTRPRRPRARTHDAAMLALCGPSAAARLNFADSAWLLDVPRASAASVLPDVQSAANEAVADFQRRRTEGLPATSVGVHRAVHRRPC
ncbi:hypothetical protein GUJ93_ZPchr0010g11235 [Zizania palustris]|uniref:Uncharacterized protein n=1 Tax=Zizania palustris TaxID=103762 RepID=A0A8J5WGB5_ZIZPA|nr:hypothetical protein GUJ93_ZPchr0010g11235 [Zizania palustris]